MVRPPQPPCYTFVIDVSHRAVNLGIVATVCKTVKACLDQLPGDERTMVRARTRALTHARTDA